MALVPGILSRESEGVKRRDSYMLDFRSRLRIKGLEFGAALGRG
jgi:hypothetical protein